MVACSRLWREARDSRTRLSGAYAGVRAISFDGMQYRKDIGRKALAKQL